MSDAWGTILSTGAVAVFAFLLAMGWDLIRFRREQRRRDASVMACAKAEIDTLIEIVQNNLNLVGTELQHLKSKKATILNPLDIVGSGFWDLVKIHTPQVILQNPETLSKIRHVSRRTDQVAEMIRSRESFRVTNQALSSFHQQMEKYDKLLQTFQNELVSALQQLKRLLEASEQKHSEGSMNQPSTHLSEAKERYLLEGQKAFMVINGAGAVALLAFLQAIWGAPPAAPLREWVLYGIIAFAVGVALSVSSYPLRHRAYVIGASTSDRWLYRACYWFLPAGAIIAFLFGLGLPVFGAFRALGS